MSAMINSVLTNQFFLMFLAIATGLLIGKIKIGSFSLGVSGGIFTGIVIGYFVTKWAHTVEEGQKYYSTAKGSFLQVWLHRLSLLSFCCFFLFPSE